VRRPGSDAGPHDGDALSDLRSEGMYVRRLSVHRKSVELDVISGPHFDVIEEDDRLDEATQEAVLLERFQRRYAHLRARFPHRYLLVVCGDATIDRPQTVTAPELDPKRLRTAVEQRLRTTDDLLLSVSADDPARMAVFVLTSDETDGTVEGDWSEGTTEERPGDGVDAVASDGTADDEPRQGEVLGVVAVVGVGNPDLTISAFSKLLQRLAMQTAANAPLYLVGVEGGGDREKTLELCHRCRVGLLLVHSIGANEVITSARTAMERGAGPTQVTMVPCPGFKPGTGTPGLAHLSVDIRRGEVAISLREDLGSDRAPVPVQVARPLPSASRVSSSERRLYEHVSGLIEKAAQNDGSDRLQLAKFDAEVRATWHDAGYTQLGNADGSVPLSPQRFATYNLLLLLRERNGRYDILLSNHSPLRPSALSDWNTLLLPAFKSARELLEHLRDDVMRQVSERAEDFDRAERAANFEQAVSEILERDPAAEAWADELREVAATVVRKISPTTGAITDFDYRLVTLLPLVERGASAAQGSEADRLNRRTIVDWLDRLEVVRLPDDGLGETPGLPVESLHDGGAALRWDPTHRLSPELDVAARRRVERAYPGVIWFPLDLENPAWERCPAIRSRNLDVLSWVWRELNGYHKRVGRMPDEFVLGAHSAAASDRYEVVETYPYEPLDGGAAEATPTADDDGPPARSTFAALEKVKFLATWDLKDGHPYAGAQFLKVWLKRCRDPEIEERHGIFVFPADGADPCTLQPATGAPLGMLRPVQRFVLVAGLKRAAEIQEQIREQARERLDDFDPWGFVRVRKGAAPRLVSVTPPIIERLHSSDRDSGGTGVDFVLCDGNHRVVQRVWNDEAPLEAVAVVPRDGVKDLPQPYYAHPFGRLEWSATAENELRRTPEQASKYLVRRVKPEQLEDDELRQRVRRGELAEDQLYRRYYRDLEKGFGYLGGQGGRFA
jgi:hypothetical protein